MDESWRISKPSKMENWDVPVGFLVLSAPNSRNVQCWDERVEDFHQEMSNTWRCVCVLCAKYVIVYRIYKYMI
jgi:hypothetical protein